MLTGLGISRGVQVSDEAQGLVLCLGSRQEHTARGGRKHGTDRSPLVLGSGTATEHRHLLDTVHTAQHLQNMGHDAPRAAAVGKSSSHCPPAGTELLLWGETCFPPEPEEAFSVWTGVSGSTHLLVSRWRKAFNHSS